MTSILELSHTLAQRDPLTYVHSERTAGYAEELARELGLGRFEVRAVATAGLLHDIGKLAVPDSILKKPGPLTPEEERTMRLHPVLGAQMVEAELGMTELARWIRHHHERWDGLGYPDGLAGEAIPLESRILQAADVLEAMTSRRVYGAVLPIEQALERLERAAGTQLDPEIAMTLVRLVRRSERDVYAALAS